MESLVVRNALTGAVLAVLLYLAVFGVTIHVVPPARQFSLQDCGLSPGELLTAFPNMNSGQAVAECKRLRQERQAAGRKAAELKAAEQKVDPQFQQLLDDAVKEVLRAKEGQTPKNN